MTSRTHKILIRDDGELKEVRSLLTEQGLEWANAGRRDDSEMPTHLLISSGAQAIDALEQISRQGRAHHFLHVIVIDRASRSLRAMLERYGCDMVLQRPVHPTVLRLLTQRALYPGREKRQDARVAIGEEVKLKSGLFSRSATLAELSTRGCGLVTEKSCSKGSELKLTLPGTLTGGEPLTVRGEVVGSHSGLEAAAGRHSVALVFRELTRDARQTLQKIMKSHAVGPTGHLVTTPGTPTPEAQRAEPSSPPEEAGTPSERRSSPRAEYTQSVLARSAGVTHSLVGRDLSLGGMRVAAEPGLAVGDRLHLAIYGNAGVPPVIVTAEIVRHAGDEDLGLTFGSLTKAAEASLQAIVSGLEMLGDCNAGTVISEVLEAG